MPAGIIFTIDPEQQQKLEEWLSEHETICRIRNEGAIGGKLTYSFTPNSIGEVVKVTCACGGNTDLSDYNSW